MILSLFAIRSAIFQNTIIINKAHAEHPAAILRVVCRLTYLLTPLAFFVVLPGAGVYTLPVLGTFLRCHALQLLPVSLPPVSVALLSVLALPCLGPLLGELTGAALAACQGCRGRDKEPAADCARDGCGSRPPSFPALLRRRVFRGPGSALGVIHGTDRLRRTVGAISLSAAVDSVRLAAYLAEIRAPQRTRRPVSLGASVCLLPPLGAAGWAVPGTRPAQEKRSACLAYALPKRNGPVSCRTAWAAAPARVSVIGRPAVFAEAPHVSTSLSIYALALIPSSAARRLTVSAAAALRL